ncbi:hypothetical protein SDJN02_17051, partial [Cucurbita argyrosperma subsp. argyrosperma]
MEDCNALQCRYLHGRDGRDERGRRRRETEASTCRSIPVNENRERFSEQNPTRRLLNITPNKSQPPNTLTNQEKTTRISRPHHSADGDGLLKSSPNGPHWDMPRQITSSAGPTGEEIMKRPWTVHDNCLGLLSCSPAMAESTEKPFYTTELFYNSSIKVTSNSTYVNTPIAIGRYASVSSFLCSSIANCFMISTLNHF